MKEQYDQQTQAHIREYHQLVGKRVKGLVVSPVQFGERFIGLEFGDGTVAWCNRDEEGNGPGFLAIEKPEPAVAARADKDEWAHWNLVCKQLHDLGAVTAADLKAPRSANSTPGQRLLQAIREWGKKVSAK